MTNLTPRDGRHSWGVKVRRRRGYDVALRYFNAAGADRDGDLGELNVPETDLIPLVLALANLKPPGRGSSASSPTARALCWSR